MAAYPIDLVRVYGVQVQARRRLFEWVRPLTPAQYTRPFPFGLATIQATLIEIARSEHYYTLRLRERPIPPFDETYPISLTRQPTFADLEAVWEPQMGWVRATLAQTTGWDKEVTSEIRWHDRIITLTAMKADIATQLLFHDVHHRAQTMAFLRQLGVPAQNLDYAGFVHRRTERVVGPSAKPPTQRP